MSAATPFDAAKWLRDELLVRYETSAAEYLARVYESDDGMVVELPRALPASLLARLDPDSMDDGDPVGYRCRRCLAVNGLDHGSDDMSGLCDDCWCVVDGMRERWGAR